MATERELSKRIKSIKNISQVTSALAAVSAAKANKAQRQVEATRSYAGKAFEILNNLASQPGVGENGHPLLSARQEIKSILLILITGNRGLAGAFNSSMVSFAERFLSAWDVPIK
ncbi:ATP synthase gamma chain, partial [hydrothermal vent metagenome]